MNISKYRIKKQNEQVVKYLNKYSTFYKKIYMEDCINRHLKLGTPFAKGLLEEMENKILKYDGEIMGTTFKECRD